jgi:hypothetical protein
MTPTMVRCFAPELVVLIIRRWQLSEPRRLLRYVVGDEITVRMELWHHMNLLSVEVVFEHREDPNITLTLSGGPEFMHSYTFRRA